MSRSKRSIIAYCDPQTARPGDTVNFMVSTYADGAYQADLVRVINGDELSPAGRFKEFSVPAPFCGEYPGREQQIHLGSYVHIDETDDLDDLQSFTVALHLQPTTTHKGEQFLVSRWDHCARSGWALSLNSSGQPTLLLGDGSGDVWSLTSNILAPDKQWTYVAASFDASTRQAQIFVARASATGNPLVDWPVRRAETVPAELAPAQSGAIRIAAARGGPGNASLERPAGAFNGKIERVRLFRGVPIPVGYLTLGEELVALGEKMLVVPDGADLLADWNFSLAIGTTQVMDRSGNELHGRTVNLPLRAVKGLEWSGEFTNWREAPEHYGAIYFHDDDLYDAEWQSDFSYAVPDDLVSGLYAARLRHGEFHDRICFFVSPARQKPRSAIALLMPTAHYMAYSNHVLGVSWRQRFPDVHMNDDDTEFLLEHPELGRSLYCFHSDDTEVNYSSRLRPMIHIRPGAQAYNFVADTDIIDWLHHEGVTFDVITDDLLHEEGLELLNNYRVVMTGTHPEYYSRRMLDAAENYVGGGGRLMYLGGNGFYWAISYHAELPGVIEVRRLMAEGEGFHEFDGLPGSAWVLHERAPQKLTGVGFVAMAFFGPAFYRRQPGADDPRAAFIFEGVDDEIIGDFGNHFGGAAGEEVDCIDESLGTPQNTLLLARSDAFPGILEPDEGYTDADVHADMTFLETKAGGAVFSTGSIAWCASLNHNDFDNNVARITLNVLRRFADAGPFDETPGE